MAFLITMLIVFFIVIVICFFLARETDGNSIIVALVFGVIAFIMIKAKTTRIDDPVEIPISELSIMSDDEVAIIRYNDMSLTFDNVKEYKAIKDSLFSFTETKEYNILGEHIDETYKLSTNN